MNDISEIWSFPWHALQRRLADGLPVDEKHPSEARAVARRTPAPAGGWMLRARNSLTASSTIAR